MASECNSDGIAIIGAVMSGLLACKYTLSSSPTCPGRRPLPMIFPLKIKYLVISNLMRVITLCSPTLSSARESSASATTDRLSKRCKRGRGGVAQGNHSALTERLGCRTLEACPQSFTKLRS